MVTVFPTARGGGHPVRAWRARLGGACAAALVAMAALFAGAAPAAALTDRDRADLERIEQYLNGVTTVAARFMQVSPDGGIATGSFYLSRPGRMRVEYDPPVNIMMVSTGRAFFFYDGSVDQTTQLPLSDTPAYFLVGTEVRFGDNVRVHRLTRADDHFKVRLSRADRPQEGEVELVLSREPLQLVRWNIYDPDGRETKVALLDAVFGADLEERLFLYSSPTVKGPND